MCLEKKKKVVGRIYQIGHCAGGKILGSSPYPNPLPEAFAGLLWSETLGRGSWKTLGRCAWKNSRLVRPEILWVSTSITVHLPRTSYVRS